MKNSDEIKIYKQIPIPKDSSWERFTIRKYFPIWIKEIYDGIVNIFRWIPIIYKNKNWDGYYIYDILKHKLLLQREYLVHHNRTMSTPEMNKYITICLNLIERIQGGYYELEYFDYHTSELVETPFKENLVEIDVITKEERFDEYINKNKLTHKKVIDYLKQNQDRYCVSYLDKELQCRTISMLKHEKARKLLFKILEREIDGWWD